MLGDNTYESLVLDLLGDSNEYVEFLQNNNTPRFDLGGIGEWQLDAATQALAKRRGRRPNPCDQAICPPGFGFEAIEGLGHYQE